jgi:FHA domain/Transcriptional regulatory protein, C terminal
VDSRQLLRGNEEVHLSPKAFDLLQMLVEERPRAMSKSALQDRLWPLTFVTEANLPNLIGEIRAALGDDSDHPYFIRTVRRFGYAFVGTVEELEASVSEDEVVFLLVLGQRHWRLKSGENVLGRSGPGATWFNSTSVSRRHARIVVADNEAVLEDLGSKNGTFVEEARVTAPVRLFSGDRIRLGSVTVTFRTDTVSTPTETLVELS